MVLQKILLKYTNVKKSYQEYKIPLQHFSGQIKFPQIGYYEVWARASDQNQTAQPMVVPGWNPKGYLNNACHRIAVKVI